VSGSGISWAICKSAPRSRQITMPAPHHSLFTGWMPFLPPNQQHQSTHTFNGPLSGTTWVNRYQKGKTNLDLQKQETASDSDISWAICKSAPCSRQITMPTPHHSVFYRPDALPTAQPTASKHWRNTTASKHWRYKIQTIKYNRNAAVNIHFAVLELWFIQQ